MTRDELLLRFPKASRAFINANATPEPSRPLAPRLRHTLPQQPPRKEPLDTHPPQARGTSRTLVRIIRYGQKLLDPDNLTGGCKPLLDALRYQGLIPDDDPATIILEVAQLPTPHKKDRGTRIEIIPEIIPPPNSSA